jgi:hypothetical protein
MSPPPLIANSYPPVTRGTVIVWGMLARLPFGGMVWQVYHHLIPLRRLGFDVWYVEESDNNVFDAGSGYSESQDPRTNVSLLHDFMERIGFGNRWIYGRPGRDDPYLGGRDRRGLEELYRRADAIINLCGAHNLNANANVGVDDYRCLIYLDTDPVETQVRVAKGDEKQIKRLDRYHHYFTYGENLGNPGCSVPVTRYPWQPTRPPVCLDLWSTGAPPAAPISMTTIANLKSNYKTVEWNGSTWHWSKHFEFEKFLDLPRRTSLRLELALGAGLSAGDLARIEAHGWNTVSSRPLDEPVAYRNYIQQSQGEFTVAREQYVVPKSGWFSDRSVCYLACGRPVIMQDTAFGTAIPTGKGLLEFGTIDEAQAALESVAADYAGHSMAALEIAHEFFDADKVIGGILQRVGLL